MIRTALSLVLLLVAGALSAQTETSDRSVAVTFDDLPFAGTDLGVAEVATDALLVALATRDVPASGFVNTAALDRAGGETRAALLEAWLDAGHRLENHSRSHPHYNGAEQAVYLADVAEGHDRLAAFLEPWRQAVRWYRAPFNEVGETAEKRRALLDLLASQRVALAPFTVEHSDWMFDAVYRRALDASDHALAARVRTAYVAQLDRALAFAEATSRETFGREIPQVLLLHANRLNADAMPAMLDRMAARGYRFVTLDEASADPAYDTPNAYEGKWGISWLHRWRVGLGLPNALRDEPGPPAWLVEAYETGS